MDKIKVNDTLNLKGVPCPQNSAKALFKLAGMYEGEILEIIIDDGEPIENVPASLEDEGFDIIKREKASDGLWHLFVKAL